MSAEPTRLDQPPARYGETEWRLRQELACCYRLVDHFDMTDLVYNHITARLPEEAWEDGRETVLINGFGLHYSEITAANLIKIDLDGNALEDSEFPVNRPGYVIHSAIHRAREDVACIIHTHSLAGCAVSALEGGFTPYDQQSMMFHERVVTHDLEGIATDTDEQQRLVDDLGAHDNLILRHHGLLTVGRSVGEAFRRIYYLERACRLQLQIVHAGVPAQAPPRTVSEHTARQWDEGLAGQGTVAPIEWPALMRLMDRKDPGYRGA